MTWLAPHEGHPGRPPVSSDVAIRLCLSIKAPFGRPLWRAAGMATSLLRMADLDWPAPDCSTLCRRQKTLSVRVPFRCAAGSLSLLIDSTGVKFLDDGEWQTRKHGAQGRRQWRKVHLAMDTETSDIRAVEFTPSSDGDGPLLPEQPPQTAAIAARDSDRQTAETHIRIALMNRFNELGAAEIVRVA